MYDFKLKSVNIEQLNRYMLTKTLSMFEWENLPDTIPRKELEFLLQTNGYAFITKADDGELYAFNGSIGGRVDAYNRPLDITINNPHLKFNKTLSIKDDGVLICNDDLLIGLIPLFNKHNTMLIENDINMILYGYNTRTKTLLSASDDKTKASAETYLKNIVNGDVGVIAENAMFEGVRAQSPSNGQGTSITAMTEYHQYVKASLYNEIGLSSNFNMKRERLISAEIDQSEDSLFPYVYNMMQNRLTAVDLINTMFETSINVDFGSVWHYKNRELIDGIIDDNEPLDEPLTNHDEPLDEPLTNHDEPLDEPLTIHDDPLQNPPIDDETDKDESQAKTIDELFDLLNDENLSDDDIKAIELLITEIEDKTDD